MVTQNKKVGPSALWHLVITDYCVLAVTHFLVLARDGVFVIRVQILVFMRRFLKCLSLYRRVRALLVSTTGYVISLTSLSSAKHLLVGRFNARSIGNV